MKLGHFCNASIHCSDKELNDYSSYYYEIKNNHSEECIVLKNREIYVKKDTIKDIFKNKIFSILNKENEYSRQNFKKLIADEYNKEKYNFQLTENKINNIISEWK